MTIPKLLSYVSWILIGLVAAVIFLSEKGPQLAYITSDSMVPTLNVDDGVIVWPAAQPEVGDIIVFRPVVLDAAQVSHRIVATQEGGFVTQGDHLDQTDQAAGEPLVTSERIIGRVVSFQQEPVTLPAYGVFTREFHQRLGTISPKRAAWFLLGAGIILMLWNQIRDTRTRSINRRWRVGQLYRRVAAAVMISVLIISLFGSGVRTVDYLASENPSDRPDHVTVNKPGTVTVRIQTAALVPMLHLSRGLDGSSIQSAPRFIPPRGETELELQVPAQKKPGWYHAYFRVDHYPPLLPYDVSRWLYQQHPLLALAGATLPLVLILLLAGRLLPRHLPLKAFTSLPYRYPWKAGRSRWHKLRSRRRFR